MIKVYRIKRIRYVNSLELYQAFGYSQKKYYLWIQKNLFDNNCLVEDTDYFRHFSEYDGGKKHRPREYMITAETAKAICVSIGTVVAGRLKNEIKGL